MTDETKNPLEGFRKIGTDEGISIVKVRMWNPYTEELKEIVVDDREYAYSDGPFMAAAIRAYGRSTLESLRRAPVDEAALRDFNISHDIVFEGAKIEVVKGRKVPIGTTGTVRSTRYIHNRYGRWVATYADFVTPEGDRCSTNVTNLRVTG